MLKYRLLIAYNGSQYSGWQVQKNENSIQMLMERALFILLKVPTSLVGSGRTDAGVHALGQVAHFTSEKPLNLSRFLYSLNALLPSDIRILEGEEVPLDFHARYSAIAKTYHYHLYCEKFLTPFSRDFVCHVPYSIDRTLLKEAAKQFVGTHDFTSFANDASKGSAAKNPIRTLKRLDLYEEGPMIRLEFEGDGFLYKMIRNIVGTLLEIASHQISLNDLPDIFAAKDRRKAGHAAPAQGLFLVRVEYRQRNETARQNFLVLQEKSALL